MQLLLVNANRAHGTEQERNVFIIIPRFIHQMADVSSNLTASAARPWVRFSSLAVTNKSTAVRAAGSALGSSPKTDGIVGKKLAEQLIAELNQLGS